MTIIVKDCCIVSLTCAKIIKIGNEEEDTVTAEIPGQIGKRKSTGMHMI